MIDFLDVVKGITQEFDKDKQALFEVGYDAHGVYYLAANGVAARLGATISKMKFRDTDMGYIRARGYTPRKTNGEIIGRKDIVV